MDSQNQEGAAAEPQSAPVMAVTGNLIPDALASSVDAVTSAQDGLAPTEEQVDTQIESIPEEQAAPLEPWPARTNVRQEAEVFAPLPKGMENLPRVAMPSDTEERTKARLDNYPNVDVSQIANGAEWVDLITQARRTICDDESNFRATVDREDSDFRQAVPSEKGPLSVGVPRFKEAGVASNWTGERAMMRVRALTGLGSIVQFPLWHSGIWVTLKAPSEAALLELNRRMTEEKVTLGRMTHGLAYSNNSVFFAGWITDFVISNIYETSVKAELLEKKPIRQLISCLDVQALAWGLACAIWPKGFPYAKAVVDSSGQSTKVIKELVSVGKLMWTDIASLTPWQINHMANRNAGQMSEEALARYQGEFTRGKGRRLQVNDHVAINTRVPTLEQYLVSGQRWVNNIVSMVDRAFSLAPGDSSREQFILEQGKASYMRQFAHWVESITVNDNEGVIDHEETVEGTLDALSANDEIREKFIKDTVRFIEDSTISVIAVPATEEEEKPPLPRFPHLLPIDSMSVFFTLLVQKVLQIQIR